MMMNPIAILIKQQEAAVEMLRMLVDAKRARPERLEEAINELNRLKAEQASGATTAPVKKAGVPAERAVPAAPTQNTISQRSAEMSEKIHFLRKDQAELSNLLHKVPAGQSCPELVSKILELHEEIENTWTEKRFQERNQFDQVVPITHDQQPVKRSQEAIQNKAELSLQLQKLREKISKLKKKIADPKATEASRTKWEIQLKQAIAAMEEVIQRRATL